MSSIFKERLDKLNSQAKSPGQRRWIYMPYDQVSDRFGPLCREKPEDMGLILIENAGKAARRPYHKQKLALILANLRHFALEQAARGVAVRHVVVKDSPLYSAALAELARQIGPIEVMEPAEKEMRDDLSGLVKQGALKILPHEGWLTSQADLQASGQNGYRMDAFYRRVRQRTGLLMEGGKPRGGKYSFDNENRQPWKGEPQPPQPPAYEVSPITEEVGRLIEKEMANHPGRLDLEHLPASQQDHDRLWSWALENCLPAFGPYEDAMSTKSTGLFHSRISASLNIHRLLPRQIIQDVLALDIPLASQEGFIRQVLGWREFVHQVHVATNGFAELNKDVQANFFAANEKLPAAFWGKKSGLNCLDTVVQSVWEEAYSHHITRLMILCNLGTLLDLSPRELCDWFWVAYSDAYDWVVEPNVLAMGTYAVGGLMTTKPYISGAAYINKMSDYCRSCRFDPAKNCPITRLYWAFLERHQEKLQDNIRLAMPLNSLKKRAAGEKLKDRQVYLKTLEKLLAGEQLEPIS